MAPLIDRAETLLWALALTAAIGAGCKDPSRVVTEEEARQSALRRIERVQAIYKYNARALPPPSVQRGPDGYAFEIRDEAQNVSIVAHVSWSGLAEISAMPLDEDRRIHEEAMRKVRARRGGKAE